MFDLIRKIRAEQTGLPIQPAPARIQDRLKLVEEVVSKLYKSAAPQNQDNFCILLGKSLDYTNFGMIDNEIHVPSLLLLEPEEIPHRFRFTGIDDPRLNDETLLKRYSDWLCDKLQLPKTENLNQLPKYLIQANLLFLQDREKVKEAIKFCIMHELGHYYHNDIIVRRIAPYLNGIVSLAWPICLVLALNWPLYFAIPFVIVAVAVSWIAIKLLVIMINRYQELRADAFAIEHCPESIEGGIHLFKSLLAKGKMLRDLNSDFKETDHPALNCAKKVLESIRDYLLAFAEGDNVSDLTHPARSKRIAFLEEIKQQRSRETRNPVLVQV